MSGIAELRFVRRKIYIPRKGCVSVPKEDADNFLSYWSDPVLESRVSGGVWEAVPTILLDVECEILETTDS